MLESDERSCDVCPSQAMATRLSSVDLEQGAAATGRERQAGSIESGMASVPSADSGRITPDENGEEGLQGLAPSYDDVAPTRVRAVLIPARGDTFNRGDTVVAQHDDCTPAY
jgi:hypothetical protein